MPDEIVTSEIAPEPVVIIPEVVPEVKTEPPLLDMSKVKQTEYRSDWVPPGRVDKLTAQRREAEERARKAEIELSELRGYMKAKEESSKPPVEAQKPAEQPKVDDYPSYDAYTSALIDYKSEQKLAEYDAKRKAESDRQVAQSEAERRAMEVRQKQVAFQQTIYSKVQEAKKKYPDWLEATGDKYGKVRFNTEEMNRVLLASPDFADVVHYIGLNDAVYDKIAQLSMTDPIAASREVMMIESMLKSSPPVKIASSAPPPMASVAGTGGGATVKKLEELPMNEYMARRDAERTART